MPVQIGRANGDLLDAPDAGHDGGRLPLAARYQHVRHATEALCKPLSAEDCVIQPMPDASPAKWHLAHTSWFFETFLLQPRTPGFTPFHPEFGYLFNSYYNAIGQRHARPNRGLVSRPGLDEIYRYRSHVDRQMQAIFDCGDPDRLEGLETLVDLGLHHEQQHQELILTDINYTLSCNPLKPAYQELKLTEAGAGSGAGAAPAPLTWKLVPEGLYWVGHDGRGFCFDNELPRHRVFCESFQLGNRLVTNGEYLSFMADGGYGRPELWLSDGWNTVQAEDWRAPLYWEQHEGRWWSTGLNGLREVAAAEPVCHVSYYEADAYARWADARLPTEMEWELTAEGQEPAGNFVEDGYLRPLPAPAAARDALSQLFGDVWEWTGSAYLPYPGYRPAEGALGEYNGKFMCNQMVLRGGSCATPSSHIRASYRNFFPPGARWQFSGIRLARDAAA